MRLLLPFRYRKRILLHLCLHFLIFLFVAFPISALSELKLHFIDVGQGDAILVQCDDESMLVDAGPREAGAVVNRYLKQVAGISRLDYVVATHEHDDHLYGMPDALSDLEIGMVYSPPAVSLTYWIESVLPRIKQTAIHLERPYENQTFPLGKATVTFLNTDNDAGTPNDRSLVIRIEYMNTSCLLTGDIEGEAEIDLISKQVQLRSDVLKVAHHGGNTSTTEAFLNAVAPGIAVISVGSGNKHGHPHAEPLRNLDKRGITVYRTDLFGTIVGISDGESWNFEVSKAR